MLGKDESNVYKKSSNIRVLIVEDDPGVSRTVEQCLKKIGITNFVFAGDGLAAWKEMEPAPSSFDLIISDWNMPFVTGIELLEHIREANILTPFIMITAKDSFEAAIEAKTAGVTAFVPKPFTVQHFNSKVFEVLGSSLPSTSEETV